MQIYLPIAEMSVNIFLLLGIGGGVGWLSGLFGVGGGFLMTPLLIFLGVAPAVAVGTGANQIVASSVSGVIAHWRRGNVDVKMGAYLILGGTVGSGLGVLVFRWLRSLGQVDLAISLSYITFLGIIGGMMFVEGALSVWRAQRGTAVPSPKEGKEHWVHHLPLKVTFHKSKLHISLLLPFAVGLFIGVLASIMGVGGGFIAIPAMVYLLRMPMQVVIGTSLFQIIFISVNATILQAWLNQTVDIMLTLILLLGAVVGAQFGAKMGGKIKAEQTRLLLSLIVLAVCGQLAFNLMTTPEDVFSLGDIVQ